MFKSKIYLAFLGLLILAGTPVASGQPVSSVPAATEMAPRNFDTTAKTGTAKVGDSVRLRGTVQDLRKSSKDNAPHSFMLKDDAGTVRVCVWSDVLSKVPGAGFLNNGAVVELNAQVKEFQGKKEVHVTDAKSLTILPSSAPAANQPAGDSPKNPASPVAGNAANSPAVPVKIHQLTSGMSGRTVTVTAKVGDIRPAGSDRAPWTVSLTDESSHSVEAVFWKETADQMTTKPAKDETWRVTGQVSEFRGKTQIKADSAKAWQKVK